MGIKYNNKYIIPAPFVDISTEKITIDDGRPIGETYNITLNGSILSNYSGIVDSYNDNTKDPYVTEEGLSLLLEKQNEIRNHFSQNGYEFEIEGIDSAYSVRFYPEISDISFGEGGWYQRCQYTINMAADDIFASGDANVINQITAYGNYGNWKLQSANSSYEMDNNFNGTIEVSRSVGAVGKLAYDPNNFGQLLDGIVPWQQASGWVASVDSSNMNVLYSGIVSEILPNFSIVDTAYQANLDENGGEYSIERSWLVSNTGVYTVNRSSSLTQNNSIGGDELSLTVEVEGIGYKQSTKYNNALTFWSEDSITSREDKIAKVRGLFDYDGNWYFTTFGESFNETEGNISVNISFAGNSGVTHTYTANLDTNWIGLPEKTLAINGTVVGTGDSPLEKRNCAINYYQTIDFDSLATDIVDVEWSGGDLYLQNQSVGINNDTGDISYTRNYTHHESNYKDTWTVELSENETSPENDVITVNGNLQGLASNKELRWTNVYSAFTTYFPDDSTVWNSKVVPVLGDKTPPSGFVVSRTMSSDYINGTINYGYTWNTSPASGSIDYSVDSSYDRATDLWTVSVNGTARGVGTNASERISNAMSVVPHENEAWQHAYETLVSKLDDNSSASDSPRIEQLPNERYMTSRSFNADENLGVVTFNFSWNSAESGYINTYNTQHSWDEKTATETVSVNGTIKGFGASNLDAGWTAIYNGGDPDCPASIYAARHTTEFADDAINVKDTVDTATPIGGSPKPSSLLSINRAATLDSSSYAKNENTNEITYSFSFSYKAWPYGLPLWIKNVSMSFNEEPSADIWVEQAIIGKRSGPVHQDMNARTSQKYVCSVSFEVSKRKMDQFGKYIMNVFEEYADYVTRRLFLDYSGYSDYNYGHDDANRNCYIKSSYNRDHINGVFSRNTNITALSILD